MPRSMTAFARHTIDYPWGAISCELRSVNSRYLETHFRMPDTVRASEMALRELARQKLTRGKLDISLSLAYNQGEGGISADLQVAQQYLKLAEQLAANMANPAPLSALDILRWPGVIKEQQVEAEQLLAAVKETFAATVEQLIAARQREGDKLAELIEQRLVAIGEQLQLVRSELPSILDQQRQRLRSKLAEFAAELDQQRLEQEMVIIANRADVDEELDRLDTHIAEIRRALADKKPSGRRLDFLMQELNREANTLGSKSLASLTTQVSVELKVLIEQMREQIQNIE
ncbi:YicC family protein [Gammaproteobacteria bacterium LSUCC0057]|uniref:YicC family protein n=1 Tax=Gammaproteobacteria bacterium LSUCC0057 TaxID=2559237 RepID=A0A4Y8UJ74_9GAMM|nr:YicC family protein [Gammaproteobacteria bacterium LSUCC0057]